MRSIKIARHSLFISLRARIPFRGCYPDNSIETLFLQLMLIKWSSIFPRFEKDRGQKETIRFLAAFDGLLYDPEQLVHLGATD